MPPSSKSRSSVAAELVLALSKPKGKILKEDEQKNPAESSRGNDWISFLKTKQGNETSNSFINNSRSTASKTPIRKSKKGDQISSPNMPENIKSEPFEANGEISKKKKESEKDLVLKSLMDQVSSLETTLGGKIQSLEASLKSEKSKCKQLETTLEREIKLQKEASSKLKVIEKDFIYTENELRTKIATITLSLEEERRRGSKIAADFAKYKVDTKEELNLKDVELIEIQADHEELISKVNSMIKWKEELAKKVADSIHYCRIHHTDKLQTVIDENLKLRSVMKAAKDNFHEVTDDMSRALSDKDVENCKLQSKVLSLEEQLSYFRMKSEINRHNDNNRLEKELDKEDSSMTEHKEEEDKMNNVEAEETEEENSRTASRKRKRKIESEDVPVLVKKSLREKQAQEHDADNDVEILSNCKQGAIDTDQMELMKRTKENLRDAILSSLSSQDEPASLMDNIQGQSNNLDESLLKSPEFYDKIIEDDTKQEDAKGYSSFSVTLDENVDSSGDEALKEDTKSPKVPLPSLMSNIKQEIKSYNSLSDNFFRLINECEDKKEEVKDEYDEVDIDTLYGDLEPGEQTTEETHNSQINDKVESASNGLEGYALDESFGSLDSNELVIDLDTLSESLLSGKSSDISYPFNITKEILDGLVHSI